MFKVNFPMHTGIENEKIVSVLPEGWMIESTNNHPDRYWLVRIDTSTTYGNILKLTEEIVIAVDEKAPEGMEFWQQFGAKYPDLNPFSVRYGVIYLPEGKGELWKLNQCPKEKLREFTWDHYSHFSKAFQVSYLFGNWHPKKEIILLTCRKINHNGSLGKDEGKRMFLLGNFEK